MSDPSDTNLVGDAVGGVEVIRHWFRDRGSNEPLAWATVFEPPAISKVDVRLVCAGSPEHEWVVLLSSPPEDELFAAAMAQAIVRSPVDELRSGHVVVDASLWRATTPNNDLPYRYRLSPAAADVRSRYEHCLLAMGYGPPAFLAETIAAIERALVRAQRLIELQAPDSMVETDLQRAGGALEKLREFSDDETIVATLAADVRELAAELLRA